MRALVLAAGRGERLRPLTDRTPKPLLPVLGAAILERTLIRLARAGVEEAAINLHHLGDRIEKEIGDEVAGMRIVYSREETLLGTLGPLARLRDFLAASDPILLVNGDSLCDWPVEALLEAHAVGGAAATLLLATRAETERFGGGVVVDGTGSVVSFRGSEDAGARRAVFAGFHVLSPALLEGIDERPSDIVRDLYEPMLAAGTSIGTLPTDAVWHDLGTPRRYLDGVLEAAGSAGWRHDRARIESSARWEGSVIEAGAELEAGASVRSSLVLAGGRVGAGAVVEESIVGPGVEIRAGATCWSALLTAGRDVDSIDAVGL